MEEHCIEFEDGTLKSSKKTVVSLLKDLSQRQNAQQKPLYTTTSTLDFYSLQLGSMGVCRKTRPFTCVTTYIGFDWMSVIPGSLGTQKKEKYLQATEDGSYSRHIPSKRSKSSMVAPSRIA